MDEVAHILERIIRAGSEVGVVERRDAPTLFVGTEPCRLAEVRLLGITSLVERLLVGRRVG